MNDPNDQQLLRDYAAHRSEAAFAELVRRHVNLVYSAALRMVCDAHLAQDVTQATFVALAQSATHLTDRAVLSGWLHCTAQNLAGKTVRTEVRRRAREQEAVAMNELLSTGLDASWEHIAPHLDAALGELSEPDRDALLLRYFEKRSAAEIGSTLGISAEAAQKRVSRAVERLREFFAKHGVSVGAGGLVAAISANAVQTAPAGLAVTISAAALAGTAATASTLVAATTKTVAMTTLQKTLVTATVAVLAGAGIYEARQAAQLRDQVQTLQQQQEPLAEQISKLQNDLSHASNTIAGLQDDITTNKKGNSELLKLRGEIGVLRQQQSDLDKLRQIVTRNHLLPTEPEFHLPQINSNNFVQTTYPTGPAGMETNNYGHPMRYTMYPSDVQSVSIQGFLNQCMEISGWHYLIDRDVVAGSVKFGLTNAVNGAEFVQAFENALMTGTPEFWADGGKTLRKENLVLIHYPYEKTVVVMTQDKAGVWPQQK